VLRKPTLTDSKAFESAASFESALGHFNRADFVKYRLLAGWKHRWTDLALREFGDIFLGGRTLSFSGTTEMNLGTSNFTKS
jgi:hypothetical protein